MFCRILALLVLFRFFIPVASLCQQEKPGEVGILFYNVENLFNPENHPEKDDDAFTPKGDRRWTHYRKVDKQRKISRVILFAGKWNPPVLVGLCEVEDRDVLEGLIFQTGLDQLGYHIVHFESPDERGIDVALLYRRDRFNVLKKRAVPVVFQNKERRPTRDILYVKGVIDNTDTLHVMVNHWPSRWGGEVATRPKRITAAKALKALCDSIRESSPDHKLMAMGDFNDEPMNQSLNMLSGPPDTPGVLLVNLALYAEGKVPGTIRFRHEWACFDQILVSDNLLPGDDNAGYALKDTVMQIVAPEFLLEEAPDYPGLRPFRTYSGFKYVGGFSDHLPVMVRLFPVQ
ncbi:MAG: endonuclease [Marinilabiliaceae bacterium]